MHFSCSFLKKLIQLLWIAHMLKRLALESALPPLRLFGAWSLLSFGRQRIWAPSLFAQCQTIQMSVFQSHGILFLTTQTSPQLWRYLKLVYISNKSNHGHLNATLRTSRFTNHGPLPAKTHYNIASWAAQSNSVYVTVLKIPIVHADSVSKSLRLKFFLFGTSGHC